MVKVTEDMTLDQIIAGNRKSMYSEKEPGRKLRRLPASRGMRAGAGGGMRRPQQRPATRGSIEGKWKHDQFNDDMNDFIAPVAASVQKGPVKISLSGLPPTVHREDLIELFEAYDIVNVQVHYDENGTSLGTGEVAVANQARANQLLKDLTGVVVDGKVMKFSIVGSSVGRASIFNRVNVPRVGGGRMGGGLDRVQPSGRIRKNFGAPRRISGAPPGWMHDDRTGGSAGGRGGRRGGDKFGRKKMTAEDLDKELEAYMKK